MKKILFVIDNWFGDLGGKKKATLQLINNLDDFEIVLLTLDTKVSKDKVENFYKDLKENIKIYPFFITHNLLLLPKVFFKFGFLLKKIKPDLVISVGGGTRSNAFFSLISKIFLPKIPVVIITHGNLEKFLRKQNFILRYIIKLIYQKVEKNISVSQGVMESLKKNFNLKDNKCTFIYNGFDLDSIERKSNEVVNHPWFNENIPVILSVARLNPIQKDFITLLKSFAMVRSKIFSRLVIVGEGPQREELEKLAKELKIEHDVLFLGFQQNPYKYMAKSSVFVLSSKFEGLPNVLIEAMACGVPIISSDCDFGPREILKNGKYGILVPVGDEKKMAEAIIELLKNEDLRKALIVASKERVKEFSIEKSVKSYKNLFLALTHKNRY